MKKQKNDIIPLVGIITDLHIKNNNHDQLRSVVQQFVEDLKQRYITTAIFGGDLFTDRSVQSMENLLLAKELLHSVIKEGIKCYVLIGNHDKQSLDNFESYLDIYDIYDKNQLHIVKEFEVCLFPNYINIYMLSYFRENKTYGKKLQGVSSLAAKKIGYKNVLVTHVAVNGVRNNDGTIVDNGIQVKAFNNFDKVLVGHYHDRSF